MEANELLDTLRDLVDRLNDLSIEYMVTGSVAMSAYATARTTLDIDVIVEIAMADEQKLERRFKGDYYVDLESIREARRRYSMFNVLNFHTGIKVDFIIRKPNKFEAEKFKRRRRWKIGDVDFWVISRDDLILSKLDWAKDSHSERQFDDIHNLIESGADESIIRDAVDVHGLSDVWAAYLQWKTRAEK